MENSDVATVWTFIVAFAVFAWVVIGGIGIPFPKLEVGRECGTAMNSVSPG